MIRLVVAVLGLVVTCVSVFGCGAGDSGAHASVSPEWVPNGYLR